MSIEYRVYANDLAGGPVDLSAPVATVSALSWDTPTLPGGARGEWLVRAHDTVTGLEDPNGDARVRVWVGAGGEDLLSLPNAPGHLAAVAGANGTATVSWVYNPGGQGSAPLGFNVYCDTPAVTYTTPAAVVPVSSYAPLVYSATLAGLTGGTAYEVGVRSYNASGEDQNALTVTFTARTAGPPALDSITSSVVP